MLDQGYWPRTGITAPDDAALVRDIELAREPATTWCASISSWRTRACSTTPTRSACWSGPSPPRTGRFTAESAAAFEAQIAPMAARDGNSPAIVIWGLYNEEWGLDWDIPGDPAKQAAAARAYDLLKPSTRPGPTWTTPAGRT